MRTKSLFGFDIWLLSSSIALMVIGILFVYSSGYSSTGIVLSDEYIKQIIWVCLGLGIAILLMFVNYLRIADFSRYIYAFFIVLLVATLMIGRVVNGARSWIPVFSFGLQPSEFAKVATILFLAFFIERNSRSLDRLRTMVQALLIVLGPVLLILMQPDLGTALVYVPIFLSMAFVAGFPVRFVAFLLGAGALVIFFSVLPAWHANIAIREYAIVNLVSSTRYGVFTFLVLFGIAALAAIGYLVIRKRYFYWILYVVSMLATSFGGSFVLRRFMKEYQLTRLIVFLDPGIDPQGAGWNVIQSVTAVGSGGWFGKGWLKGTQSHYRFLPQQSTDFIFSIIAEEWGFAGGLLIFLLFSVILARGVYIMISARDRYASLVSAGLVSMIGFHVIINIGMAMGVMPITGIPLFFLSYGGSSLWTGLVAIGLLLNIHIRRYRY